MINSLVQCQLSYINTIDPNFVGGTSAIALVRSFDAAHPSACVLTSFLPQAQEEIRRSRSQVTQAAAELNREATADDPERQPLSQKSMNKVCAPAADPSPRAPSSRHAASPRRPKPGVPRLRLASPRAGG